MSEAKQVTFVIAVAVLIIFGALPAICQQKCLPNQCIDNDGSCFFCFPQEPANKNQCWSVEKYVCVKDKPPSKRNCVRSSRSCFNEDLSRSAKPEEGTTPARSEITRLIRQSQADYMLGFVACAPTISKQKVIENGECGGWRPFNRIGVILRPNTNQ